LAILEKALRLNLQNGHSGFKLLFQIGTAVNSVSELDFRHAGEFTVAITSQQQLLILAKIGLRTSVPVFAEPLYSPHPSRVWEVEPSPRFGAYLGVTEWRRKKPNDLIPARNSNRSDRY
jgi:hypothetical protein